MTENQNITVDCGRFANRTIRPIAFGGHCYYVRRFVVGEQFGKDFRDRILDGIVLPQTAVEHRGGFDIQRDLWDRTQFAEVLAIGLNVGKPCSKSHMHRFKRARCLEPIVKVGDSLFFANENYNTGILDSQFADFEKFVEESVPLAIYHPEP